MYIWGAGDVTISVYMNDIGHGARSAIIWNAPTRKREIPISSS